jgi:hypothetical protein
LESKLWQNGDWHQFTFICARARNESYDDRRRCKPAQRSPMLGRGM